MQTRKFVLEMMALIFLLLGAVGLFVIFPDIDKIHGDPEPISVADFAEHGLKKTILVDLTDFDYGSHPVLEVNQRTTQFSKVAVVLFPKGHADDANSKPVILVVPDVSNAEQLRTFCDKTDVLGIVREGAQADFARRSAAKVYPQLNIAAAPVVIANDTYGLIFYGTFTAIVVGVFCIVLMRLLPRIAKIQSKAEEQNANRAVVRRSPKVARLIGIVVLIVGLAISYMLDTGMVNWARENKSIWISMYVLVFGPVIVSQGLVMTITGKEGRAAQKNLLFPIVVLVLSIAFMALVQFQLAKEGYNFL